MISCISTRTARTVLVVALSIGALVSCEKTDRYKLEKDEQGRTIRLDQQTGEIAIIEGDTIRIAKSQDEVERDRKAAAILLGQPRNFSESDILFFGKDSKAKISTMWRDGNLYYKFELRPAAAKIINARRSNTHNGGLYFRFYDQNEFELVKITVPTGDLVGTVGDDGITPAYFWISDVTEVSKETYESIAFWNLGWYGY